MIDLLNHKQIHLSNKNFDSLVLLCLSKLMKKNLKIFGLKNELGKRILGKLFFD